MTKAEVSTEPTKIQRIYRPQPAQEAWHACSAYESGFGGAKFGGKSYALLFDAARDRNHPAYRGIVFRREYPRLEHLLDLAHQWYPGMKGHWRGDEHRWVFPSGANILFRHCQAEDDKYNYQGHSYHYVGFDQLEEFTEGQYLFLLSANRSTTPELQPKTRSTFNPGGIGHIWLKRRFIDQGTRGCPPWYPQDNQGRQLPPRCFHFSTALDNPAGQTADPWYMQRLLQMSEEEQRAYIYGDWDVFAGQMFTTWRHHIHVIQPFPIPPDWRRWGSLDYGYEQPTCFLWHTTDPQPDAATGKRRIFTYRELYCRHLTAEEQGVKLLSMMTPGERLRVTYADPSLWARTQARRGLGLSLAFAYPAELGLVPANNDRLTGVQRIQEALRWIDNQKPEWQIFSTCTNLVRTLPSLVRDSINVEDVDTDGEDHAYDSARYGLVGPSVRERPTTRASVSIERSDQLTSVPRYTKSHDRITRELHAARIARLQQELDELEL